MGYGDLFVAGTLGAVLAAHRQLQRRAAILTALLALAFNLLFLVVPELPATVPVAAALLLVSSPLGRSHRPHLWRRRRPAGALETGR
jgi:hypothetical protein